MHNDTTQMGDIIRNAREAKELTQAVLAERIEVSLRTIVAIEKSKRNPTYDVLKRLVHALDISADLIFFPDTAPLTTEQNQLMREFMSCDDKEKAIVTTTLRSLIRALRHDAREKQN